MGRPDTDGESEMVRFHQMLYAAGVIYPFNWSGWHHEAERLFRDPEALESADEMTLSKLLTYHSRVDHFNDEHFDEMIESGHIAAILQHLKELQGTPRASSRADHPEKG